MRKYQIKQRRKVAMYKGAYAGTLTEYQIRLLEIYAKRREFGFTAWAAKEIVRRAKGGDLLFVYVKGEV